MKKIATLLLAAGLVFGVATGASAIDFKAKGQWIMSFDYGQNGNFTGGNGRTGYNANQDEFESSQRVRLQLDAVASESLSGTVFFEIGQQYWGTSDSGRANGNNGGALGADGNGAIKVKNAYIDWLVPQTDLKVRMGIQGMALPSFTTNASSVLNDDVAGITASYQFNDNVGVSAFWARLYNDNYTNGNDHGGNHNNYMDNFDAFGLLVPLTFDGVKVTPWAMYASVGPNTFRDGNGSFDRLNRTDFDQASRGNVRAGMVPAYGAMYKSGATYGKKLNEYGNAFWAGLTGEVTTFDPFRIAWDFNYGSVSYDDGHFNRAGWLGSLLFEYKLDWATPGLYGWYASGDDDNPANGSERMPTISATGNNEFSNYAFSGNPYIARENTLSSTMTGTWGIGARLKDMSFVENLKHTLRLNVIGGTNNTKMASYIVRQGGSPVSAAAGMDPLYMTTNDTAMEIGLTNSYKMYDNFTIMLDAAYIATWLDQSRSVWGNSRMNGRSDQERDPWNVNVSFVYSF
ncbi:outer membrane homotrimeric porin [Desulfovibrio sp. UIB00]|uniref:outer membrane homotrimeric porin n=1 Tax=Desulfovibrio sp. UIB00 TaxID=2804314 RepID=UPI001F0F26AF|nr:outer membrane homotrimeric porin [Desulfovibrio sp. UIB00]MCH5145266.1 outer membrane homotrimeric porin [Desulfovibrio sp. UIB00]